MSFPRRPKTDAALKRRLPLSITLSHESKRDGDFSLLLQKMIQIRGENTACEKFSITESLFYD
jgi:hypothetical protein